MRMHAHTHVDTGKQDTEFDKLIQWVIVYIEMSVWKLWYKLDLAMDMNTS